MTTQHDRSSPALRLNPFRGMRYNQEAVGDISAVTSPPYDVMDRRMIDALLQRHPSNIVRLILPRMISDPATGGNAYERAARRLERWRGRGVLATDEQRGLYVYEYGDARHALCGLVGSVELRTASERVILPHEDVIAGIVADRLALMTATSANLEPILLVYDGEGETAGVIDAVRAGTPLVDIDASDGSYHRVWALTDAEDLHVVRAALAPHQALIADGHHRYAGYLQLREQSSVTGASEPGVGTAATSPPSNSGLALLIDDSRWPLQLGAIHRSICEVALSSLVNPAGFNMSAEVRLAGAPPSTPPARGQMVLTDGVYERVVNLGRPVSGSSDAAVLHDVLLPAWGVSDDRLAYHHTVEQAVRTASQDGGIAVLLHPTTVSEVMSLARAGRTMPRKSTSFGPKPRMGLVMRSFLDEV